MLNFTKERPVVQDMTAPADYRKRLHWLIQSPPEMPFVRFEVSPRVAEAALAYLPPEGGEYVQRHCSPATVEKYARQMIEGKWRETLVPIIFTKKQHLGDGQHRMQAVIRAGVSVPFWFAFGDEDENFFVYDNNRVRGPSDIMTIKKVPNANNMASAAKWVAGYEINDISRGSQGLVKAQCSTPEDTYHYYLDHVGLQDSMQAANQIKTHRLFSPSLACALHYLMAKKSRPQADEFFEKLATGIGFSGKGDPVYSLREFITKEQMEINPRMMAVLVIDAWNAMRTKKRYKPTYRDTGGKFPRIV